MAGSIPPPPEIIPPPPVTRPLAGTAPGLTSRNSVTLYIYRWNDANFKWQWIPWFQEGWQFWPSGYYASEHQDIDGNLDWGPNSVVLLVTDRVDTFGNPQPYQIPDPVSLDGTSASAQCPTGLALSGYGNPYVGNPVKMCNWIPTTTIQACPPGEVWDPITEQCVIAPPPIVPPVIIPPPDTTQPPPPVSQPDPDGDDITSTLCSQMAVNTEALIAAIRSIGSGGTVTNTECCVNVVAAIGGIAAILGRILNLLTASLSSGGAPVDLTPIATQLESMADSLKALAAAGGPDLAPVANAINGVAKAISSAPGNDVSGIVDQLRNLFLTIDVPQPVYEKLEADGYLPKGYAALMGQGDTGSGVVSASATSWRTWFSWVVNAALGVNPDEPNRLIPDVPPDLNMITKAFQSFLKGSDEVVSPVLQPLIDTILEQLTPAAPPPIGNYGINPHAPVESAVSVAITAAVTAWLASYFSLDGGEPLAKMAEFISGAVGFEELRDVLVGPLIRNGLGKVADMQARAKFRQEIPGASGLAGLVARGLIAPGLRDAIYPFTGIPAALENATSAAAFSGFSPRQLMRLAGTNLITQAEIADELTFAGMRPSSQHRFLLAAPYLATASYRNQLHAALEQAHLEGIIPDAELTSQIDSAEHNTDRDALILAASHWKILTVETKALTAEYAALFKAGIWDDATYRAQLAGLGLQQWKIDLEAGKAEVAANVTLAKQNIRQAAATARATAADEVRAALQAFKSGASNAGTLAAALTLAGQTPAQTAAQVSLAELQQRGALRWIYGLLKSPAEATLLRERVAALADQRKRLQIDDSTFVGGLQSMGIPDRYINALRAATDALITPKTAAVTVPVSTA